MKAQTFILTAGATVALVVPAAASAAIAKNQVQAHSVLAEKTAAYAALAKAGHYQVAVHTLLAEKSSVSKSASAATQLRATRIRGDALNRKYNLGAYAPVAISLSNILKTPH